MALDLTRKVGPLPVWGWGLVGAGSAGLIYVLYKRRKSSSASGATLATGAQAVPATYPVDTSGGGGFAGGGAPGSSYPIPLPTEAIPSGATSAAPTTSSAPSPTPVATTAPAAFAANPLSGFEINSSGTPYITPQQFTYQTSQPLSAANIAASGKGGPNDLSGLAALNGGTGPNAAELAYFDSLNAAAGRGAVAQVRSAGVPL